MRALLGLLAFAGVSLAANEPDQIRLAYVPGGMTVSWSTVSPLTNLPQVAYGVTASSLASTAIGVSHTYGTAIFHDVVIQNLQQKQTYYYQILDDTSSSSSSVFNFTTAADAGDEEPFSLLLIGDMGLKNSLDTMNSLKDEVRNNDFVLHVGDISYADDFYLRAGDTYEGSWTKWQDEMEDITQTTPYMTLPGNHEVTCSEATPFLCPQGQRNFTAYKHRFRMPGPESGGLGNLWFSYDYGLAHFVHINFETDFEKAPSGEGSWLNGGGEEGQLEWLEADLKRASENRDRVPWVFAAAHRPYYSSGGTCGACQDAFEALFNKYDVDIFFSGHIHWYERLYAIAPGGTVVSTDYTNPTAPIYIVNGAAGNVEGHSKGSQKAYTAFIDSENYGYGRLSVNNRTSLTWSYFAASDKSLIDQISIYKEH